jgi:lipoate synthase
MNEPLIQIGQAAATSRQGNIKGRPEWLRIKLATSSSYHQVRNLVTRLNLHTVCQEAHSRSQATSRTPSTEKGE